MRQPSLAIAIASVPRRRIARHSHHALAEPVAAPANDVAQAAAAVPQDKWIRLRMRVASTHVFALRQTLHRAIGRLARIYVIEVDHRSDETTLHVEVERGGRDAAMHAIMTALPAAEFGAATLLGSDHAGH